MNFELPRGVVTFANFEAVYPLRTNKFIELYDKNRDIWVRLRDDHCEIKKDGKYVRLYKGAWKK